MSLHVWIAVLVILIPTTTYANVSTGGLWSNAFFHLVFGNAMIGVFEGSLAWVFFRATPGIAIWGLILANYFSMFVGLFLLAGMNSILHHPEAERYLLFHLPALLIIMLIACWLATVVLEWPFCRHILPEKKRSWRRGFVMSVVLQAISYAVLVILYLPACRMTLYSEGRLERDVSFAKKPSAVVYFIDPLRPGVWRISLDGSSRKKTSPIHIGESSCSLHFKKAEEDGGIGLWLHGYPNDKKTCRIIATGFHPGKEALIVKEDEDWERSKWRTQNLQREESPTWKAYAGPTPYLGLRVESRTGSYHLTLYTPLYSLAWGNATILPGDQMVAQLGSMIVLVDLPTRRVGLLTTGRAPVVVMKK
ncbi:MAG: hypothetical protein HY318_20500 [Armatimonadetes bacterium]|nr:hypothetical protein [Armatimonadota bacterium]